jgi:AraC family cel operon transcriptional repressor
VKARWKIWFAVGKTQEYLTRATQRYYGKTPMQIINDIRINLPKNSWKLPTTR